LWSGSAHSNLLPFFGFFFKGENAVPELVSEWMKNGTVTAYMRNRPFDVVELLRGIASGLNYLHFEKQSIHADSRAYANILVSDEGHPLIADFGLSTSGISSSLLGTTQHGGKGTLRWMAKELLFDDAPHSIATDMWAFGMVICELLSRGLPFAEKNDYEALLAIAKGILPQRPKFDDTENHDIYEGLWSICTDCWRNNPSKRPTARN
ncbi:kinase-like protein, partial [Schizopora paradoxa]